MWKEFKEFAIRGNMIDLAIGMIIGTAFTGLVKSMVENIFNPIIGLLTGKINLTDMKVELLDPNGAAYFSLNYGTFITEIINFIIMAFVVFLFVKVINRMRKAMEKPAEEVSPTTKVCPYCKSEISIDATKCAHCTSDVE